MWFDQDGDGLDDRGDPCPGRPNAAVPRSIKVGDLQEAWKVGIESSGEEFIAVRQGVEELAVLRFGIDGGLVSRDAIPATTCVSGNRPAVIWNGHGFTAVWATDEGLHSINLRADGTAAAPDRLLRPVGVENFCRTRPPALARIPGGLAVVWSGARSLNNPTLSGACTAIPRRTIGCGPGLRRGRSGDLLRACLVRASSRAVCASD